MKKNNIKIFKALLLSVLFSAFFLVNFSFASIKLRVVAVNPSEESVQSVPIKVYLPLEIKPEHVINKGDLDVAYDTQQGSYYVAGEYELKPKEVLEKEIELKDIWIIEQKVIDDLRKETQETFSGFDKTIYQEKAKVLYASIEKKLQEVERIQKIPVPNPSQHISDFRYCDGVLNSVKADLVSAKTMLAEVSPKNATKLTWKIIIFIILFLGIMSFGFYVVWQHQAKIEANQKVQD